MEKHGLLLPSAETSGHVSMHPTQDGYPFTGLGAYLALHGIIPTSEYQFSDWGPCPTAVAPGHSPPTTANDFA